MSATDNVFDATNLIKYQSGAVNTTKAYAQNHLLTSLCESDSSCSIFFSIYKNIMILNIILLLFYLTLLQL